MSRMIGLKPYWLIMRNMSDKIELLIYGIYWGYLVTSIFESVGEIPEPRTMTLWIALQVVATIFVFCFIAVLTVNALRR